MTKQDVEFFEGERKSRAKMEINYIICISDATSIICVHVIDHVVRYRSILVQVEEFLISP